MADLPEEQNCRIVQLETAIKDALSALNSDPDKKMYFEDWTRIHRLQREAANEILKRALNG